jgi:N-6 DNA Methylase
MPLRSVLNHRGFFSDYWLGTTLGRQKVGGPRLTSAQVRKALARMSNLADGSAATLLTSDLTRFRERFVRPLLEVFDFAILEGSEEPRIRALFASGDDSASTLALIGLCPESEEINSRSLRKRLEDALLISEVDYGFIVSPEVLRLVRRPGLGTRGAAFDLRLASVAELQDSESLIAAYRVFSARCLEASDEGIRPIDILEAESRQHSARVSNELKGAVFKAAEKIVASFLQDTRDRSSAFDPRPKIDALRDAGFLALYRLLFVLYAEARDDRLLEHRLYRRSYSLESLIERLLATSPGALGANRFGIWAQMEAAFKVFNEGIAPSLPDLENIPPRGGRLFSDQTDEGKLLARLRIDDRIAAEIILGLATTRPRRGVGRERVSFRELEIEQLGSVYEGLLEYEPAEASQTLIEVRAAGRNLVLTPEEVVRLCEQRSLKVRGVAAIVEGTSAEPLHPDLASNADEDVESTGWDDDLESSGEVEEESDEEEIEAGNEEKIDLAPGAVLHLVRRLVPGEFFFRPGPARKSSGSYYTPTPMVDYVVRETLGPLAEGRRAAEIEKLRIIDLACGSAHFLVGAARYLGKKLFEAYREEADGEPPAEFHPDRSLSDEVRARWESEGFSWCKRRIVEHCLFGVDLNPSAVQLAQVALWIESLAGDRPLSFFAHHIRLGNSLLGSSIVRFDSPPEQGFAPHADMFTRGLFEAKLRRMVEEALDERRLIDSPLPPEVRGDTPEEYSYKEDRLRRAERAIRQARLLLDLRSASLLLPAIWHDLLMLAGASDLEVAARERVWWCAFEEIRERERFFHWELEFPEVLLDPENPGFDAVIGNPPWDKVLPSKHEFYAKVDVLIRTYKGNDLEARIRQLHANIPGLALGFAAYRERATTLARFMRNGGDFPLAEARSQAAHEDVAKYFVDRALGLIRQGGFVGLVVPSVFYNGDGWVGIRRFLLEKVSIRRFYGFENRKKIFPIDSRKKFVNLVAQKNADGAGTFRAAFMRHDLDELTQVDEKPWEVTITRGEIMRLSPQTLAFLEYRGPRDQEIVGKMHSGCPTLGDSGLGTWGARLFTDFAHEQIYNSARDKELFTDPVSGKLYSPEDILGFELPDLGDTIARMQERGFWPVFEGKSVEQFLVGVRPIRWWLSIEQAKAKYEREPRHDATLVFRETASNTNERTCISAVLPRCSAASHKLTGAVLSEVDPECAMTVLNSFCFDFALRLRTAGTNISFTYILPVAVPAASVTNDLPKIATRSSWQIGIKNIAEDKGSWQGLWAANRRVAEAYGLTADDFAHILAAFPVFARKRKEFHRFLLDHLSDWRAGQD